MSTGDRTVLHRLPPSPAEPEPTPVNVHSIALTVVAAAAATAILWWARAVFIPIVLSILISFALEPVVRRLVSLRLPRMAASGVVIAMLACAIGYTGYAVSDDAAAIVAELPEAATKLREVVRRGQREPGTIQNVTEAAEQLQRTADEAAPPSPAPSGVQRVQVEEPAINVRQYVMWGSASALAFAGQATLIVFFVFFLLASGDLFKRKLVKMAGPSLEKRKLTVQILDDINVQIERFLLVQVFASILVGVASWIAFRAVGLEQAGIWGIAAGIFNSVPYIGPIIVTGGTGVVAFLQFGTLSMALTVAGIALVITSLEGWLLMPLLAKRAVRTNEVAVLVSLIFWSFVWGIWGTLLAVPMLAAAKACCDRVEGLKPIGELIGE
jgi:predicted PurR-regulated permease PerM